MALSSKETLLIGITEATGVFPLGFDPLDESLSMEYIRGVMTAYEEYQILAIASDRNKITKIDEYLKKKRG